jgi:hypothetical protein
LCVTVCLFGSSGGRRVLAGDGVAGFFLHAQVYLFATVTNSHSPKIKLAADLRTSHLADFIGVSAPQVGA